MIGGAVGPPPLPEILGQTDHVRAFYPFSAVRLSRNTWRKKVQLTRTGLGSSLRAFQ